MNKPPILGVPTPEIKGRLTPSVVPAGVNEFLVDQLPGRFD